ncbi:Hypothetical predicted protein [Mytilus galloprovincialis]|uniref:Uncharacterized protein n=1 Tax=Mytilus galloprovincialis TaxID=29158 RepID=A0A8B6EH96_MYTGA|nr:Hypothetical predicted protein [Mytilus galloprovincialis]
MNFVRFSIVLFLIDIASCHPVKNVGFYNLDPNSVIAVPKRSPLKWRQLSFKSNFKLAKRGEEIVVPKDGLIKAEVTVSVGANKRRLAVDVCVELIQSNNKTCQRIKHGDIVFLNEIFSVKRNDRIRVIVLGTDQIYASFEYNRFRLYYI